MTARLAVLVSAAFLAAVLHPSSPSAQVVSTYGDVSRPWGLAFDALGNLYVSERVSGAGFVSRIPPGGGPATPFVGGMITPAGMAFSASGDLYVGDFGLTGGFGPGRIWKVTPAGVRTVFSEHPALNDPAFLEFDAAGDLLVSDRVQRVLWRLSPSGGLSQYGPTLGGPGEWAGQFVIEPSGDIVIGVGSALTRLAAGGLSLSIVATDLGSVQGVARAPGGGFVVGRNGASDLWLVSEGGVAVPWAGSTAGCVDGLAAEAKFGAPQGLTTRDSRLFVADSECNSVRMIETPTAARATSWGRVKSTYR